MTNARTTHNWIIKFPKRMEKLYNKVEYKNFYLYVLRELI